MYFDYYNYEYIERREHQNIINLLENTNNQPSK